MTRFPYWNRLKMRNLGSLLKVLLPITKRKSKSIQCSAIRVKRGSEANLHGMQAPPVEIPNLNFHKPHIPMKLPLSACTSYPRCPNITHHGGPVINLLDSPGMFGFPRGFCHITICQPWFSKVFCIPVNCFATAIRDFRQLRIFYLEKTTHSVKIFALPPHIVIPSHS